MADSVFFLSSFSLKILHFLEVLSAFFVILSLHGLKEYLNSPIRPNTMDIFLCVSWHDFSCLTETALGLKRSNMISAVKNVEAGVCSIGSSLNIFLPNLSGRLHRFGSLWNTIHCISHPLQLLQNTASLLVQAAKVTNRTTIMNRKRKRWSLFQRWVTVFLGGGHLKALETSRYWKFQQEESMLFQVFQEVKNTRISTTHSVPAIHRSNTSF